MRKRRVYLLLIGFAAFASVIVVVLPREREPEYGGKKLSEWVDDYPPQRFPSDIPEETQHAISEIGTNGIPYFIKWIQYEPSPWKIKMCEVVNRVVKSARLNWEIWDKRKLKRSYAAMRSLMELGLRAAVAIGALAELLDDPKTRLSAMRADLALAGIASPRVAEMYRTHGGGTSLLLDAGPLSMDPVARMYSIPQFRERMKCSTFQKLATNADWNVRREATNAHLKIDPKVLESIAVAESNTLRQIEEQWYQKRKRRD